LSFDELVRLINDKKRALKRRKRLIISLSLLAIMGLSTATYAWFTVNTFAGIEDFELKISTGEQLLVSMENHGTNLDLYTHTITNEMINSYLKKQGTSLDDIVLDPVTSNDGSNFTFQYGTSATANESYLEYECYFIATCDMWVHLTTEDANEEEDSGTKVSSSSPSPKSEVTQATRVDFETKANGVATYEPNKSGQVTKLTTFDLPKGTMTYKNENRLFHLEKLTPTKVTVRLWIDGEDPQCDDDIQEANLRVQLSFIGCDDNNNPIS
jgi:hypothetical protein